ncbi:MAG TPA: glycoside hydrolase family 38 C-terminal domain-containing protein [Candidatus Sulfotelmatobacter sp.]|nr:glycoside hydrolase family 38 C-terminal domain-containing protein [Candidatus Sulfotelmatobacter sp.]
MKCIVLFFSFFLLLMPVAFSQTAPSDSNKPIFDRLDALTRQPEAEWRSHEDIPHPEDPGLNDSAWATLTVKNVSGPGGENPNEDHWRGTRVFRRWIQVPEKINGYATQGSHVWLNIRFGSPGSLMITVFSNGAILYRGDDENILPVLLTENAQPGQKFLIAARVVAEDQVQSEFFHSELTIDAPPSRPDPALLRLEMLAAKPIIAAYEEGKAEREQELDAAAKTVDFSALDRGDQAAFDASLKAAQTKLEPLKPWLQQFTIRAVGNSHIDMAWLWPWTETVEVVRNTFQSVLDLMREYPDFKFTMSSARTYEWMQEKYPDLFAQIQQRVKEGRWEVIGGMWVEPDLNMPDGESLVRQILVGKRYFQKNFGVDIKIGWNPDSFGYNYQLPQIYKKSGMDYFVTQKLLWAHEFTTFPYKLFWWQSPDGSRLLTYFPHDYAEGIDADHLAHDLSIWAPSIYGKTLTDHPETMHLYGVGDHGGGPTRVMLDHAEQMMAPDSIFPKLQFSFASDFFNDLDKKLPSMQVPTWDGELYFQYHRGVFTTQAETKRRIRHSEENVLNAEKFASIATLFGRSYPQDEMELAWKRLLFDHFHDIMPGSGIAVNYLDAKRNLENVDRAAGEVSFGSLNEIAAHVNTQGEGTAFMLFNSLSWPRTDMTEVETQLPEPAQQIQVVDSSGKPAESQLLSVDKETHRARFLLLSHTPSLGYATYFVRGAAAAPSVHSLLKASPDTLENEFIRLKIDPQTGCMTSLFDKRSGMESLAPPETDTGGPKTSICGNLLQTFVDQPKQWDAWNIDADFEKQHWDLDKADEVNLVESGPLRAIIRVKNHFQNSTFVRDIMLYAGVPRVDVNMQVEWHEKHILLKVAFPLSAHSDKATYEIPFGSVERPTTRKTPAEQAQFEVPAQRWADISDSTHGFSLLNDCKYGYDGKGNVLRLSLLRSPEYPDPHADQGHHEFTYSLYPHSGSWKDALTIRRGYELNYKLIALPVEKHAGTLPAEHAFLQTNADNIIVSSMKKAEDENALVVRFYEWAGKQGEVTLELPQGAQSASETNLMEKAEGSIPVRNDAITVSTKPYEIKTVRVAFGDKSQTAAAQP